MQLLHTATFKLAIVMATARSPKLEKLTENETLNSFLIWKDTLLYTLDLDKNFNPFISGALTTWSDADTEDRGFADNVAPIRLDERVKKGEKAWLLTLMLGQVANWCTVISRHEIVNESTPLESIWAMIREHYGFHVTGSR